MTCVGHNTCLHRPQHCDLCQPQHLFTLATIPVYVGHNTTHLRWPIHLFMSTTTPAYIGQCCDLHWPQHLSFVSTKILACTGQNTGHNTSMCQQKYWPALATTVKIPVYVGQSCDLCRPQHLLMSATTPLIYVGQNISLRRPKHLFTSASAVTCIGHNTSHLRPQKYWPAPATTQVTTLACVKKNTCLRRPQRRPASVKILACINKNSCLCQPEHWPASVKNFACAGHNSKNSDLHQPQQ